MSIPANARKALRYVVRRVNRSSNPWIRKSYVTARTMTRATINGLTHLELGWMAHLLSVTWEGPTHLRVTGYAFERGLPSKETPTFRVWFDNGHGRSIEGTVEGVRQPAANQRLRGSDDDYINTGFAADFDLSSLFTDAPAGDWQLRIESRGDSVVRRGRAKSRFGGGAAGCLVASTRDGRQVIPVWESARGLLLRIVDPAVLAEDVQVDDRTVTVTLRTRGVRVASAVLLSASGPTRLELVDGNPERVRVRGEVVRPSEGVDDHEPDPDVEDTDEPTPGRITPETGGPVVPSVWHRMVVTDTSGHRHDVATALDGSNPQPGPEASLFPFAGPEGRLALRDATAGLIVEAVEIVTEPVPALAVEGTVWGDLAGAQVALYGPRQVLAAEEFTLDAGRFRAFVPLLASTWGSEPLPPKSGTYVFRGQTRDHAWFRISSASALIARFPETHALPGFGVRLGTQDGRRLALRIGPPRREDELGSYNQRRLEAWYRSKRHVPENAVFFESFYGRISTCNPRALDAEIARTHPDWKRYWSVQDRSIAVPDGAIPVVEGTKEWWTARGRARYVIINDWLRRRFQPQPHQVVLQTWHGSMLKRIGLDRPTTDMVSRRSILAERANWDLLLSQNAHSTEIFRSAYAWTKPILEEGYPRNDAMVTGSGAEIRRRLGIGENQVAILYAPTWRDNRTDMVTFLDLGLLTAELGPEYVVLLRGHSRTMHTSSNVSQVPGVIDVTTYPEITELFLAADALITDYSSVMFDFSVTGKPMIFFVPDMADYRDSVRGVYFDLSEVAPGPVLATQDEVTEAIRNLEADRARHAERYAAWRERFNHHDDGHSAERVVERLFATSPPPRGQGTPAKR